MKKSILARTAAVVGAAAIAFSGATGTASAQDAGSVPQSGSVDLAAITAATEGPQLSP